MTDLDILQVRNRKAYFYAKGQTAHDAGQSIDSHGMNPGSACIADFKAGWRNTENERRQQVARRSVQP
jgi:hypothetical protein